MTIKKAYVELIKFLEDNKGKKVSTILDEAKAMCEAKNSSASDTGSTFLKNEEGEVVAIFCYYYKKWMPLCEVEFGTKKGTASGYNTMCKSGVSQWTKQQREASKAKEVLLAMLVDGEIEPGELPQWHEDIETKRKRIEECKEVCFDTSEQVLEFLNS